MVNESLIIGLYVDEKCSGREISKKTGYALTLIQRILKKHNITRNLKEARINLIKKGYNHPFRKKLDENKVINLYTKENISIPKIAKMFGCSLAPILRILKENKIPTKSPSESHKGNCGFWEGKKRPDISERMSGRKVSKQTRKKLSKSHLGQKSIMKGKSYEQLYGVEESKKLRKKISESHIGQISSNKNKSFEELYGVERAKLKRGELSLITKQRFSSEEARKAQSERILKFIEEHPEWRELKREQRLKQKFPSKHTLPEKLVFNEMQLRDIKFEKHKTIFNRFQPDAVITNKKIAIFVDGDYWHANPRKYNGKILSKIQINRVKRDKEQNELLKKDNWIILRFWESDIKKNVAECVDKIEKEIFKLKNKL